ncbi:hypothetical protein GCM10017687_29240 [Streptomyces echinatus]
MTAPGAAPGTGGAHTGSGPGVATTGPPPRAPALQRELHSALAPVPETAAVDAPADEDHGEHRVGPVREAYVWCNLTAGDGSRPTACRGVPVHTVSRATAVRSVARTDRGRPTVAGPRRGTLAARTRFLRRSSPRGPASRTDE